MMGRSGSAVAFQGEAGAYGEEAASHLMPGLVRIGLSSFDAVFDAVRLGDARYGVVPVENVYAGPVSGVAESWQRAGIYIGADLWLPVQHVLAGLPGSSLEAVTVVRSHPQALAQCAPFLDAHGMTRMASTNTATAARELSRGQRRSEAVIASPAAARRFGLQVLDKNVSAARGNRTRFWLLAREPFPADAAVAGMRLTAVVETPHPGTTASVLSRLRDCGGRTERVIPLGNSRLLVDGLAPPQIVQISTWFSLWSVYPRMTVPS